jgi:hypothetical protein
VTTSTPFELTPGKNLLSGRKNRFPVFSTLSRLSWFRSYLMEIDLETEGRKARKGINLYDLLAAHGSSDVGEAQETP